MPTFASLDDLKAFLGRDITTAEAIAQADLALELATGAIQSEVGQVLFKVEGEEVKLHGTRRRRMLLPELPVLDVLDLEESGIALVVDDDFTWDEFGILTRVPESLTWFPGRQNVVVTYDHGYEAIPKTVQGICLAVVGRAITNPEGIAREHVTDYDVSYAQAAFNVGASIHLLETEKRMLDPFRP